MNATTAKTYNKHSYKLDRRKRLMPKGVPKYCRVYDNGGVDKGGTFDRYTVVFTGRAAVIKGGAVVQWPYLSMSEFPFSPQGFGQHGHSDNRPCDLNKWGWAREIGKTCHLGRRIKFSDLPKDCQEFTVSEYRAIWKLK